MASICNFQPPPGGCELKRNTALQWIGFAAQPPPGGCELKQLPVNWVNGKVLQPPPGGCELKHLMTLKKIYQQSSRLRAAVS